MALSDSRPEFLRVCQATTDSSAHASNEADEIHAVFCRTQLPRCYHDKRPWQTSNSLLTNNTRIKPEMATKVQISRRH